MESRKRRRWHVALGIVFLLLLILISVSLRLVARHQSDLASLTGSRIILGFERPGVVLELVTLPSDWSPTPHVLRLTKDGKALVADSLASLQGQVHLSTPEEALKYVRLKTCPFLVPLLGGYEYEVIKASEFGDLSDYGLSLYRSIRDHSLRERSVSGVGGVLSLAAYQAGGFAPARVTPIPGGFLITRWTYYHEGHGIETVQHVKEFVMKNGAYRRYIIKAMVPPRLPGTTWIVSYAR